MPIVRFVGSDSISFTSLVSGLFKWHGVDPEQHRAGLRFRHEYRHAAADVRQSVMSSSSPPSFPYSFFPGIPVFVPPFSGNFRKIFPPNAYRPPDDEFRTLGISADFLESGRGFRKKSRFFRHHPRHSSRLRHLHAWYIGKKIHDPIEILEKIVTFYAADRPAPNFAHRVYLGINTKSDRDSQKKSPLFRCIRSPRPIRTFGISAKKLKSDRGFRKKSRFSSPRRVSSLICRRARRMVYFQNRRKRSGFSPHFSKNQHCPPLTTPSHRLSPSRLYLYLCGNFWQNRPPGHKKIAFFSRSILSLRFFS